MTDDRKQDRLAALIAAYGADAGKWPEAERNALTGAEPQDPALHTALEEARALDALLELGRDERPMPSALRERILAGLPRPVAAAAKRGARWAWMGASWARAGGVAAALMVGMVGGYAGAAAAFQPAGPEQTLLGVALSDTADPFADLLVEDGA